MPDYLALEWETDRLSGLLASVASDGVRVRKSIQFGRPEDFSGMTPAVAGAWLKDRLAEAGVRCDRVLVSLPRAEVVMKRLEVPDVPDDELPTLVKFQAAAKAAQNIDELYLDFLPTPRREGLPREVLVVTCPRTVGEQIRATCEAAGLQLASLGVTPVALAEVVARVDPAEPDDQLATMVITRHGPRLEMFVLRREVLIFSHATRLREDYTGHEQLQATVGEISRALVSLRGANAGLKIRQAWLLADPGETAGLSTALRGRLGCEVQMLDPFSTVTLEAKTTEPVDVSWFAGPIGLLLARTGAKAPGIDFLAPRQPPVRRDPRRAQFTKVGIGVAAALLVAVTAYGYEYLRLSNLVEERLAEDRQLAEFNKRGEEVLKSANAIESWQKAGVAWLDQFRELTDRMPATDRIYLSKLEFKRPLAGDAAGMITLDGFARDRSDAMGLIQKLGGDSAPFRVMPSATRPSKDEPHYAWSFESDVIVEPAKPDRGKVAVKPPAAKTPPGVEEVKPHPKGDPPKDPVAQKAAAGKESVTPKSTSEKPESAQPTKKATLGGTAP